MTTETYNITADFLGDCSAPVTPAENDPFSDWLGEKG